MQRLALNNPELLLLCGFIQSDGNPIDGKEKYSHTQEADRYLAWLKLGDE